jgi:hypothetical protein
MAARRRGGRDAAGAWARFLALAVTALAGAAPARAQREPAKTDHFLVYAESGASAGQARRVADLAERAFGRVTADLGYAPKEPIAVIVFGRPSGFVEGGAPPHAVGTVTSPHNVIRIDLWRSQDELYTVTAHEVAHVILARALRSDLDKAPRWFNEGVATWVSRVWTPDDDARAQDLARAGRAAPPAGLNARFTGADEQDLRDAYVQSAALVEYLTRLGGSDVIARIVKALDRAPDFDTALRQTAGVSQAELYGRWLRDAGGRARWPRWTGISPQLMSYVMMTVLCVIFGYSIWRRRARWRREHEAEGDLSPDEVERARKIEERYGSSDDETE